MEPIENPPKKKPSFFLIVTHYNHNSLSSNSISQPSQQLSNSMSRQKDHQLKCVFGKSNKWRSRLSIPQSTLHSKVQSQALIASPKTQLNIPDLKKHHKSEIGIIHDRFMQFLLKKGKKFGNGINTVILKKKQQEQKNGLGELARKLAVVKPLAINQQTIGHKKTKKRRIQWRNNHRISKDTSKNQQNSFDSAKEKIQFQDDFSLWKYSKNSNRNAVPGLSFKKKYLNLQPWKQCQQNQLRTMMETTFNRTPQCSFSDFQD